MISTVYPPSRAGLVVPEALLSALETGIAYLRPVYAADNPAQLLDLAFDSLNPVAQRLLGLPAFPVGPVEALLPQAAGFAGFCRACFLAHEPGHSPPHGAWQQDLSWRAVAQRQGEQLVLALTAAPPPLPKPQALPPAEVLNQAPMAVCLVRGPQHLLSYFNPACQLLLPRQPEMGHPLAELLPPAVAQSLLPLLNRVYATHETYTGAGQRVVLDATHKLYLNLTIQAYQEAGQTVGLLLIGYDITRQMRKRRQVHKQKLQATHEALQANYAHLAHSQRQVQQLNHELEARVAAGIAEARQAYAEADCQRQRLTRLFQQSPAAISMLSGPELAYEFVNARYQQLFPGRQLLGLPLAVARPDFDDQENPAQLRAVYETGITHEGREMLLRVPAADGGPPVERYFDCLYQPRYDGQNRIDGVLIFSLEVTEQVLARRQMQQLNQELETRVAARTREAQAARAEAEAKHQQLHLILEQAPAAMAYISGPELRITSINPAACHVWGQSQRALLGRPLLEALPQLRGLRLEEELRGVMHTQVAYRRQAAKVAVPRNGELLNSYFNFVYQPITDGQTGATDVLVVAVEVTEQVHAYKQVRQLNQELETRVAAGIAEARQAHAKAEHQRQRLESFFQQAPVAIGVFDGPNLVFELVNPAYQQRFPGRQLLGLPLLDALPELVGHISVARLRSVYATGVTDEAHEVLLPVARPDNGQVEDAFFDCIYQARFNEQGSIDGVILFALDVTAKVKAQQRAATLHAQVLQAAQRQAQAQATFHQVFDQTSAAIAFLRGPDFRFEYVNRSYERLFPGIAYEGRPLLERVHNVNPKDFLAIMARVYQTGQPYVGNEVPVQFTQPDGTRFTMYLNFTYQAFREQDSIVGISVFAYDVTEQVLARQQREVGLAQMQTVFEQAPVALALLAGPTHIIEVANPAICDFWDQKQADIVGRPLFEVRPNLLQDGYPAVLADVWRTGEPYLAAERAVELLRQGHRELHYFHFVFQPLRDALGEVTAIMLVATDVSQRVVTRRQLAAANDALRATNAQLTRTNADLDNFIYTASHDLKAPISNIESLLLLLRQQLPPEARQAGLVPKVLRMMQDAIGRFQLTIAHLTDLSRLQQAHNELAEAVSLEATVEAVRLDLAYELETTHARLTVDVQACPTLLLAPHHLRSVVYNLLSNALKYRHADRAPNVHLHCYALPNQAVLTVRDNGLGLSAVQQQKIFRLFRRLHAHVEGSGVGLYMVKRIVENAGGTITVQSKLGVGSTFIVSLPTSTAPVSAPS